MKRLLLIDAHALIHRVYHALPPLTDKEGNPAGALYGISSLLLKILREEKLDYIMAFFDRPEPTLRKQAFKDYKIHRPKADEALVHQLVRAQEPFKAFGIKTFEAPGYEADDLIGAAVERFRSEPDLKITIVSGDLDLLQLVIGERIVLQTLRKGLSETMTYDEKTVIARYGLPPQKLPEYKGLVGDNSDNIPGVLGIGPKTAQQIIQKYHTLENFLATGQNEKGYDKIKEQQDKAFLSRDLARLHDGITLAIKSLEEAAYPEIPKESVLAYLNEKGFGSLARRLEEGPKPKKEKKPLPAAHSEPNLKKSSRNAPHPGTQSLF